MGKKKSSESIKTGLRTVKKSTAETPDPKEQEFLKSNELKVHRIELELQNEELRMQRDKAEEALTKYSDLYSEIYNFTPVAYFSLSRDGEILELNLKACELLGSERTRLLNRNFRMFLAAESRQVFSGFLSDVFGEQKRKRCEIQISRNKSVVYSILEGTVSEKEDKCLAMALDITDRKRMELELEQAKNKLTLALDNGRIGLWEWDIEKDILKWDPRMEEIFGLAPGTFDQKHSSFENFVHEDDLPQIRISIEKALTEGNFIEAVYRTKEKNGKSNYIMSKAFITRDRMSRPVQVTGVCFDVTKIQEGAESHIVKLNEELLKSNSDLRQFAYVASHDLQEPLRMVASFTQLLQMQYRDKLDSKANEYINYAVEGSKRMYDLLNGLLAFSRIQTRGTFFEETSMETVMQKVSENLRLLIDETGAEINSEKLPVVKADQNQMIQLMQNLIGNSIKFCNRRPSIHVSCRLKKRMYIFSVGDNGIGIEPQYFEKIFRIFQRLHSRDEYEGTGIGLAVSKKIIERHGGEIWVESVPGEGSTFSFSLPER